MRYTNQTIFEFVGKALLKQNEKSMAIMPEDRVDEHDDNLPDLSCAYRGENGLKCAMGHILPDKFYHEDIENRNWGMVLAILVNKFNNVRKWAVETLGLVDYTLLCDLQGVHDSNHPDNWERCLQEVALHHNLEPLTT